MAVRSVGHLRRINEWHICQTVGDRSTWVKSSYFLAYSLLGWAFGLQQLFWLDFYYTCICLLLCWQYYRLARAVGLGERASLVFVNRDSPSCSVMIFSRSTEITEFPAAFMRSSAPLRSSGWESKSWEKNREIEKSRNWKTRALIPNFDFRFPLFLT